MLKISLNKAQRNKWIGNIKKNIIDMKDRGKDSIDI